MRALLGVICFGPVLTVLLISAKGIALRAYTATSDADTGGGMSRQRLLSLFSRASREDTELVTALTTRLRQVRLQKESLRQLAAAAGFSPNSPRRGSPRNSGQLAETGA